MNKEFPDFSVVPVQRIEDSIVRSQAVPETKGEVSEYQAVVDRIMADFDIGKPFVEIYDYLLSSRRLLAEDQIQEKLSELREVAKTIDMSLERMVFERYLHLTEQYENQIQALANADILEELSDGKLGIVGVDGNEYPVPTLDEVYERIDSRKIEGLKVKQEQGFTQLLMVPFAIDVSKLIKKYEEVVRTHKKAGTLKNVSGDELKILTSYVSPDISQNSIVYYPQSYTGEDHSFNTKRDILSRKKEWGGWITELIEDRPRLYRNEPMRPDGSRFPIFDPISKPSIQDYQQLLNNNPDYRHETGTTLEDWLTYAISRLEKDGVHIDDYNTLNIRPCLNLNSFIYLENAICSSYVDVIGQEIRFENVPISTPDTHSGMIRTAVIF